MRGPLVILNPCSQSHPFDERRCKVGSAQDPLKIGRSVARLKPTGDNAIFDCKVLSRNHAIMWYKDGQFWLKDTKSSNGTFVNNERLAVTGEDSEPKQIYTGDIIQFGVEIVENANKVAHGCIFAMVRLYDENGEEVEQVGTLIRNNDEGSSTVSIMSSHQLFQMQQFLKETLYREKIREDKLEQLEMLLETTEQATEASWKAFVNEDRLLSRIATLEEQLSLYSRNSHTDKVKLEMDNLIMDKEKMQRITRENLIKAQEERAECQLLLTDKERSLDSTEKECEILREQMDDVNLRLQAMVGAFEGLKQEKREESAKREEERARDKIASLEDACRLRVTAINNTETPLDGSLEEVCHAVLSRCQYDGKQTGMGDQSQDIARQQTAFDQYNNSKEDSPEENVVSVVEKADYSSSSECKTIAEDEGVVNREAQLQARISELESQLCLSDRELSSTKEQLELFCISEGITTGRQRDKEAVVERVLQQRENREADCKELMKKEMEGNMVLMSLIPLFASIVLFLDFFIAKVSSFWRVKME